MWRTGVREEEEEEGVGIGVGVGCGGGGMGRRDGEVVEEEELEEELVVEEGWGGRRGRVVVVEEEEEVLGHTGSVWKIFWGEKQSRALWDPTLLNIQTEGRGFRGEVGVGG